MSQFAVYCILLLVTAIVVSGEDDLTENLSNIRQVNTLVELQNLDRGDFAKSKIDAETLRSMSSDVLDNLVQEAHAELQCSYLYFAMLHLRIIKIYMSNPTNLTDEEIASIICTTESATILALTHNQDGQGWKDIRSVMWIFHMFAERSANFLRSLGIKMQVFNENSIVAAYNSVRVLLEEFSSTNGCKMYDPVNEVHENYADRLRNIVIGGRGSARREALDNKERFWRQTEHNVQSGWVARDIYRFSLDHLLMDNLLHNTRIMKDLFVFGVRLRRKPLVKEVDNFYEQALDGKTSLSKCIQALWSFQRVYVNMLQVVAVQVVIRHMLQLKVKMAAMPFLQWTSYVSHDCNDIGEEIAKLLTAFADHLRSADDRRFRRVIHLTNRPALYLSWLIDFRIYQLLMCLRDMCPRVNFGVDFRKSMAADPEYITDSTNAILRISRENRLNVSEITDENVALVRVFVEFIKKITSTIDFDIIDSFKRLQDSSAFKRFTELENEEVTEQLLKGTTISFKFN